MAIPARLRASDGSRGDAKTWSIISLRPLRTQREPKLFRAEIDESDEFLRASASPREQFTALRAGVAA